MVQAKKTYPPWCELRAPYCSATGEDRGCSVSVGGDGSSTSFLDEPAVDLLARSVDRSSTRPVFCGVHHVRRSTRMLD